MFCMKCGNELPDNAGFCNKCGTQLGQMQQMGAMQPMQQPYAPAQKKKTASLTVSAIVHVILAIPFLILGFWLRNKGGYNYTWRPPYSSYEIFTLGILAIGGIAMLIAIVLAIVVTVRKNS